jgi:hypothetical protein
VPSPVMKKTKVWCPSSGAFRLTPDSVLVDFETILIPWWLLCFCNSLGLPSFHLWLMRYHTNFSGDKFHPVTWSRSKKNCMIYSIFAVSVSSDVVNTTWSVEMGSSSGSSLVAPVVVFSTKEPPGRMCSSTPSIATRWMQVNFSHNVARRK